MEVDTKYEHKFVCYVHIWFDAELLSYAYDINDYSVFVLYVNLFGDNELKSYQLNRINWGYKLIIEKKSF